MTQVINVEIFERQGGHYATSKELSGLFVAHKNLETVKQEIPECIKLLLEHKTQRNVFVEEANSDMLKPIGQKVYVAKVA